MVKVLFVCMGNICRSPTAEIVFRATVEKAELAHRFEIDSAGTENYHVGEGADTRSIHQAAQCGYDLSMHEARQIKRGDFAHYDFILAMDNINMRALSCRAPEGYEHKAKLFLSYVKDSPKREVPDPYYGGEKGFKEVVRLCEQASESFLEYLLQTGQV